MTYDVQAERRQVPGTGAVSDCWLCPVHGGPRGDRVAVTAAGPSLRPRPGAALVDAAPGPELFPGRAKLFRIKFAARARHAGTPGSVFPATIG